eukprot:scaffold2959_cov107-Isochrysis_galbana.AAC.5
MKRNRCTEPLAVRLQVGCLGWLRARFKAVLKAHSTVYGLLIGSRMGANSVGLKRAGSADPVEEMAAGAFARLGLRLFCLLLVPGAKECPQAPQDDAGRETPERKGLGKSQVGSESQVSSALRKFRVGWLTARAGRPGLDVPECHWMPER